MEQIKKYGILLKGQATDGELELVNKQSLRPLTAEEIFTFKMAGCDNVVDRDNERFTDGALQTLAKLFVGRTILCDHQWSTAVQVARCYAAEVEDMGGGVKRLLLHNYMLRNPQSEPLISAVEGGIMRECSVGCSVGKCVCSICGRDKLTEPCGHIPGHSYGGKKCFVELDDVQDAYETSFVAVPAQHAAGVVKSYGGLSPDKLPPEPTEPGAPTEPPAATEPPTTTEPTPAEADKEKALALLGLEFARY